jgi:hypothetical protein
VNESVTATSHSMPRTTPPSPSPWTKPTKSMKELIAEARDEAVRRRELELLREVRREVEQMVRTVEFNDPYIDVQDAFK